MVSKCVIIITKILKEIVSTGPNFLDLTDAVVTCRHHSSFRRLQDRLHCRQHWQMASTYTTPPTAATLETFINPKVIKYSIGFVSGNKGNPLDNVWLFSSRDKGKKFKLSKEENILPKNIQETAYRVFVKN